MKLSSLVSFLTSRIWPRIGLSDIRASLERASLSVVTFLGSFTDLRRLYWTGSPRSM